MTNREIKSVKNEYCEFGRDKKEGCYISCATCQMLLIYKLEGNGKYLEGAIEQIQDIKKWAKEHKRLKVENKGFM